jgi:NAD(P)-dependent dehydrogenase (short-subunit alcohol dehydrogenase family)
LAVRADLTRETDLDNAVKKVNNAFGGLDVLVNMTSIYEKTALKNLNSKVWRKNMEANLESACLLSLKCAPLMKRRGGGRIIHFSDWVAASGRPRYKDYIPYYVSKAGLIGLTEALALELAPEILVNAIAPGPILPPRGLTANENREVQKTTPLGRWGGPEEIAKAVLFLIETDFITGECIRVDGGRHLY